MKKLLTTAVFLAFFGVINAQEQTIPGYTTTGFYDDFATGQEYITSGGQGIFWDGDESQRSSVVRHEGYIEATVDQINAIDWNPLWVSFGNNPNQVPYTIDLSNAAEIKTTIANENATDFFIEFAFLLENGEYIQFQDGLNNATGDEQWSFMPHFDLPANTTKEVVIDLTNGMGGDCFWNGSSGTDPSCVQHFDMSKVVSMTYEIFSNSGDIIDAKFKIYSLKVGEIDGGESDLITTLTNQKKSFVSIYPNPVQSQLSISKAGSLSIYSADGNEVMSQTVEKGSQVNVADWSNGIYLVKLINDAGEFTTSFVKQ